jgi:hypothetical protein
MTRHQETKNLCEGFRVSMDSSFATLYGTVYGTAPASKRAAALSWSHVSVVAKNGKRQLLSDMCGSVR